MKKTILLGIIFLAGIFLSYGQKKQNKYLESTTLAQQLKLSIDEKDIMIDIMDLDEDTKELDSLYNSVSGKITQLNKLKENAKAFSDLENRINKKIKRFNKRAMSYTCESEESKNMESYLLYDIYRHHLQKSKKQQKGKSKRQIEKYVKKAVALYKKSTDLIDQLGSSNNPASIKTLKQSNKYIIQSLLYQQQALALAYKLEIPDIYDEEKVKKKDKILLAEKQKNTQIENELTKEEMQNAVASIDNSVTETNTKNQTIEETLKTVDCASQKETVVYKIQVGAFLNKIDESKFKGLYPISKDINNNRHLTKYVVGKYMTYQSALKSKSIIAKTSVFKDAFVVAYVNGQRISLKEAIDKSGDENDLKMYLSYKAALN